MTTLTNRRRFVRFTVEPMYTPVLARMEAGGRGDSIEIEGYAYDISEGGCRFDLDKALPPNSEITLKISLPGLGQLSNESHRWVQVHARVVWVEDVEDAPPYRTAAVFTEFATALDRERLLRHFSTGRYRMAG